MGASRPPSLLHAGSVLLAMVLVLGVASSAGAAEDTAFTVNPMMAKGPASAPVRIVEFSDYQ